MRVVAEDGEFPVVVDGARAAPWCRRYGALWWLVGDAGVIATDCCFCRSTLPCSNNMCVSCVCARRLYA